MGDSFTNLLLVVLITLLGFIGKVFYEKVEDIFRKIESILLSNMSHNKDIEQLQEDADDHETRITHLENNKKQKS